MPVLAHTLLITEGCPPEPFHVTFSVGTSEHLVTVRGRGQVAKYCWPHKGYRPGERLAKRAVAAFLAALDRQEAAGGAEVDEANREFAIAGRVPAHRFPRPARDAHEQQLPVADRA